MKLKKTPRSKSKTLMEYLEPAEQSIGTLYLFIMLGIFPLHVKNQYEKIGDTKYQLFWNSTVIFLGISLCFYIAKKIISYQKQGMGKTGKMILTEIKELSFTDVAVLVYGLLVTLSFALSDHKDYALKGAAGWEMGLLAQLSFVGIYFFMARQKKSYKTILGIHLVVSAITYLLGYLHRFRIDPLAMYRGLNEQQMTEFLSTIGQATWFSSYVCTLFPMGIILFYVFKSKVWKRVAAAYCILSFAILVTQNSDSAFIALIGIIMLLGLYSVKRREDWLTFWQVMIMIWGTFVFTGILQRIFADKIIILDTLSLFFSQSIFSWLMLALSIGIYFFYQKPGKDKEEKLMLYTKRVYYALVILFLAAVIGVIIFIYLNTKGYLLQWFGYQSTNNYLLFDTNWGNLRGSSWKIAWQEYLNLSPIKKLFGVGPDAFSAHIYNSSTSSGLLGVYGELRLTNAHNEYLNSLFCYGIVGLASWLAVLVGGVVYFYRKAKENPIFLGFALCIIGYSCHNIFCYQQVCCTPFLFIVLGVGESLIRYAKSNKINF